MFIEGDKVYDNRNYWGYDGVVFEIATDNRTFPIKVRFTKEGEKIIFKYYTREGCRPQEANLTTLYRLGLDEKEEYTQFELGQEVRDEKHFPGLLGKVTKISDLSERYPIEVHFQKKENYFLSVLYSKHGKNSKFSKKTTTLFVVEPQVREEENPIRVLTANEQKKLLYIRYNDGCKTWVGRTEKELDKLGLLVVWPAYSCTSGKISYRKCRPVSIPTSQIYQIEN